LILTLSTREFLEFYSWCFLKYSHLNAEQNCEIFLLSSPGR